MDEHAYRIIRINGMNSWRAGCSESCTSGSEGGPRKRIEGDFDTAPRLDPYTEHPTAEGKLHLCAVKDAFSGRIVGYSIDDRMKASLAVAALRNAIMLRSPIGTIVHSDRGSQFRSKKFVRTLRNNGSRWIDGTRRRMPGQRRDGIVLRATAEERP